MQMMECEAASAGGGAERPGRLLKFEILISCALVTGHFSL